MDNKTKLLLIRHGESLANVAEIFAGHHDAPLSEKGIEQAEFTAEYLKKQKIDAIYSSDLIRAYDTACRIAAFHGKDVIKDKNLREIAAGEWEGKKYSELQKTHKELYSEWTCKLSDTKPKGAESTLELQKRVHKCILGIAQKNPGSTVCIVMHAMAIRVFCAAVSGVTGKDFRNYPYVSNASVTTLVYENGEFKIEEYSYDKHQKNPTGCPA